MCFIVDFRSLCSALVNNITYNNFTSDLKQGVCFNKNKPCLLNAKLQNLLFQPTNTRTHFFNLRLLLVCICHKANVIFVLHLHTAFVHCTFVIDSKCIIIILFVLKTNVLFVFRTNVNKRDKFHIQTTFVPHLSHFKSVSSSIIN